MFIFKFLSQSSKVPYQTWPNLVFENQPPRPSGSVSFKHEASSVHEFDRGYKIQIVRLC